MGAEVDDCSEEDLSSSGNSAGGIRTEAEAPKFPFGEGGCEAQRGLQQGLGFRCQMHCKHLSVHDEVSVETIQAGGPLQLRPYASLLA